MKLFLNLLHFFQEKIKLFKKIIDNKALEVANNVLKSISLQLLERKIFDIKLFI